MERYKRRINSIGKAEKKLDFKTKFIRQAIACSLIFLMIFGISCLKTDTAKLISQRIKAFVTYTVDYKATGNEIKEKIIDLWKGITKDENTKAS